MTLLTERPSAAAATPPPASGIAAQLEALATPLFGGELPFRLRAWDGSEAGPIGTPVAILRSPACAAPAAVGPGRARARAGLRHRRARRRRRSADGAQERLGDGARPRPHRAAAATPDPASRRQSRPHGPASSAVIGRRLPAPASQAKLRGRLHTKLRDRSAISHHYDLSNDFYALVLDPRMAYSCALLDQRCAGLHARRRAARQVRSGLPQAGPASRPAAARRRMRLGLAVVARGRALRRARHRHHALARAAGVRVAARGGRGPHAIGPTSGCRTTAT